MALTRCRSSRTITGNAANGPDNAVSPHQFSPLWNPPFRLPPSNSNKPKGENRRGTQRGGFIGAAGETVGTPLSPRNRAPPPYGLPGPQRRSIPLALKAPAGQAHWSGRGGLVPHTSPPFKVFVNSPVCANHPPCAFCPPKGAARWFGIGGQCARGRPLPNSEAGVGVHARSRCETRAFPDMATGRPKATGNTVATLSSKVTRLFHGWFNQWPRPLRVSRAGRRCAQGQRARERGDAGLRPALALRAAKQ
jgi:hypothetical protein